MIKVYRYGLLRPVENEPLVREQMRLAHRYRNTLVEIERHRRQAQREILTAHPGVADAEADARAAEDAVTAAYGAAADAKGVARSATAPEALRQACAAAKGTRDTALTAVRAAWRVARADAAFIVAMNAIDERARDLRRNARAHCGCYWGNYLIIEDADERARKVPLYDGIEPNGPRFVRWEGEGAVAVQVQHGITPGLLDAQGDTRIRIEPGKLPPKADPQSRRSALRRHVTLALRVGSDDGRGPIWARWPMIMHRPLPTDAVVKWAKVVCRRIGTREEWFALLTVQTAVLHTGTGTGTGTSTPTLAVGVDLGWRVRPGGLRVCAWHGEDEAHAEFVLPTAVLERIEYADALRGIRDKNFDLARAQLAEAIDAFEEVPDFLREARSTMSHWRSQGRLAGLVRRWATLRFAGDERVYDLVDAWAKQDRHLWDWEASQRTKALRHRREIYRVFAAEIASRYRTLVIEKLDLRRFAKRPKADAAESDNERARALRVKAVPSEFRLALRQAFLARGGEVVEVDPADTTRTCNACGSIERWDQAAEVRHACAQCGREWDQDENAARNILARRERSGDDATPGGARSGGDPNGSATVRESKWARAKRMHAKKAA